MDCVKIHDGAKPLLETVSTEKEKKMKSMRGHARISDEIQCARTDGKCDVK